VSDYGSCFAHNLPTKDESGIQHLIEANHGDCVISNSSTEQAKRAQVEQVREGL
jgi:hypothetical protein